MEYERTHGPKAYPCSFQNDSKINDQLDILGARNIMDVLTSSNGFRSKAKLGSRGAQPNIPHPMSCSEHGLQRQWNRVTSLSPNGEEIKDQYRLIQVY